jgi:hypothetical protein
VNRLPIRVRLTLGFALAMAVVLAGMGLLVYVRVGGALLASVDQTLHSQAAEAAVRAHEEQSLVDPDAAGGATLAQLLAADGTIVRNSRAGLAPLIDAADARAVAGGSRVLRSITLKRPEGDWRVIAIPTRDEVGVVVVARSLEPREETLRRLFRELLIAGPLALLLASLAGYALAAAALRPVGRCAAAARRHRGRPGRLPVPPAGRVSGSHDANHARPSARRVRARGSDAATSCELRWRCCAPSSSSRCGGRARRRSSRRRCVPPPRRPSVSRGSPRTCC